MNFETAIDRARQGRDHLLSRAERRRLLRIREPPATAINPEVAAYWLHRCFPAWQELLWPVMYPDPFRDGRGVGLRALEREPALRALRTLKLDVEAIVAASGRVLATGRPETMVLDLFRMLDHTNMARELRAVVRWEAKHPVRGTRSALRRALRIHTEAGPDPAGMGTVLAARRGRRGGASGERTARPG